MQAALDLAESGIKVYLLEREPSIGGGMVKLDKIFPTTDCAMCTIGPRLVTVGRHLNIEIISYADLESVEGEPGNYKVRIKKRARSVDPDLCTGCSTCYNTCLVRYKPQIAEGQEKESA